MKLIFEKSQAGRRGGELPHYDLPAARVSDELRRQAPPRLPELAEPEIVRHFTELSTRNFGIDTGFYPLGSCTMKHNPRVNERVVNLPGFRDLHPLQEEDGVQGALELEWRLQEILKEVCGLDAVSLQPAAGWSETAGRPATSARISWRRHMSSSAPCAPSSSWSGCRSRKPGRFTTRSLTRGLCFIVHEPSG